MAATAELRYRENGEPGYKMVNQPGAGLPVWSSEDRESSSGWLMDGSLGAVLT